MKNNMDNAIGTTVVITEGGNKKGLGCTINQNFEQGRTVPYKLFVKNGVDLWWTVRLLVATRGNELKLICGNRLSLGTSKAFDKPNYW